jgi:hypothetical protein
MATVVSGSAKLAVVNEFEFYGLSGDVKKDLLNYLDNVASAGDFATMEPLPEVFVNPNSRLLRDANQEEVEIGIPLSLQDAQKLINAAHQAEHAITDTSLPNPWELDPSQFSLSEEWQPYVDTLMRAACDELGVRTNNIRTELQKMLLYEKGTMPKPYADDTQMDGVFGTLVISLPSAHFGGNVVLSYNGEQHEFQTSYHECLAW